jgi:hypothetical protein
MFKHLQQKWKVNGWQLLLILITFALGGSTCGWLGRTLLKSLAIENKTAWIVTYIISITLLWPLCVLVISIPLGQFAFFRRYLWQLFNRKRRTDKK